MTGGTAVRSLLSTRINLSGRGGRHHPGAHGGGGPHQFPLCHRWYEGRGGGRETEL